MQSAPDEIRSFLQGPDPSFKDQSEYYLVRGSNYGISLGQIWAALATFKGDQDRRTQNPDTHGQQPEGQDEIMEDDEPDPRYSKRARRNTNMSDFVDSGGIQVGSSSPPHSSSRSSHSLGYVDPDAHFSKTASEDDTLRLASCVIRYILYFAAPQDAAYNTRVVEFRDSKARLEANTASQRRIVAIDDGGLCLRQAESGKFSLVNNHVAILEAKTRFQYLEEGIPVISDECFAQMVCEALAASIPKVSKGKNQSVILIHATRNYMCFLQFDITDDYLFDLDSENTEPLEAKHFLYVSATRWFDLSTKGGREGVVANICGIMRLAISDSDE